MPIKIIYYSEKTDDPIEGSEVIKAATVWAKEHGVPFSTLVNMGLRVIVGLKPLDVKRLLAIQLKAREESRRKRSTRQATYRTSKDEQKLAALARRLGATVQMKPKKGEKYKQP